MICSSCKSVVTSFKDHFEKGCKSIPKIIKSTHPYMSREQRLKSFLCWPYQKSSASKLVDAGFFFTKKEDCVECYWCSTSLKNWQMYDDPIERHLNANPGCMFLWKKCLIGKTVISCKDCNQLITNFSHKDTCRSLLQRDINSFNPEHFPCNPSMENENRRWQTFHNWPLMEPFVKDIVDSGLYYIGYGDVTKCFSCPCFIGNWSKFDNPIEKHLQMYPDCVHVQKMKKLKTQMSKINYNEMKEEFNRLSSFRLFPKRNLVNEKYLAKIGFFYLQYKDYVQCAFCKTIICEWKSEQNPLKLHVTQSPNCPYLEGLDVKNVPLQEKLMEPLKKDMESFIKRLSTFSNWTSKDFPEYDLAEQGFYLFNGILKCFWCDFEINDITGNYLEEHATIRPDCLLAGNFSNGKKSKNNECKICFAAECDVVLIPCNHLVTCITCSRKIDKCCICRRKISQRIEIFKG